MSPVMAENLTFVQIHWIVIDPAKWEVLVEGIPLSLTSNQFRLLHFLASNAGKVFTRQRIIEAVHGPDYAVTEKSVDVQIVGLRKKLGNLGTLIHTERGIGFRFQA